MLGTMMSGVVFRGAAIWQRPFDNGTIANGRLTAAVCQDQF
jgi:hypothetical protein